MSPIWKEGLHFLILLIQSWSWVFLSNTAFFFINLTKCSAPGGIKFLILIFIWSTFWEKTAWNIFILNECEWFFGNTPQQTLNNWNFQDKKSIYVSQYHCNVMTRAKWKGWPEYSSASPRPRRAVMSTSQRWKLPARPNLHAGICSSHHCPPRHRHHHRRRHLREKTKTETKTRTSPFVRTCQNKLLFAQTGGQTCGLLTEIYSSIDAILKRRDWPMNEIHL